MCDFGDNVIIFDPVKEYDEDGGEVFSCGEENSEYLQDSDYEYDVETEDSKENLNTEGKFKRIVVFVQKKWGDNLLAE